MLQRISIRGRLALASGDYWSCPVVIPCAPGTEVEVTIIRADGTIEKHVGIVEAD